MPATHALRDKWFVSFLPLLVPDIVASQFKGDWNLAAQKHMQRLDWVTSVEELWSTVNSLPKVQQLGVGSTYIFSRNDKDPSYETFPNGARVVVSLFRTPATDLGVETVLATVLGESIAQEATDDKAVCDVIRISARPSREHNDTLRVEVWLNDQSYSSAVAVALKKALLQRDIGATLFSITDSPFESTKSPVTTTNTAKGVASPISPAPIADTVGTTDSSPAAASSPAAVKESPVEAATAAVDERAGDAADDKAPVEAEATVTESPQREPAANNDEKGEATSDDPAPSATTSATADESAEPVPPTKEEPATADGSPEAREEQETDAAAEKAGAPVE